MWMLDLGREQAPSLDHLRTYLDLTRDSGYNAIGLYFEHRFAFPSAPWAHGSGCVTPEMVRSLQAEYPDIQIVPFLNLLGHFEGFLYTEQGKRYRESLFEGMQACPTCPEFVSLCKRMIDDAVSIFTSHIIHIGGDETWQLGQCERCRSRLSTGALSPENSGEEGGDAQPQAAGADGKARLYGEHFGPLAKRVADAGRRPAVWGDMFLEHPGALDCLPKEALVFDWQYHSGLMDSATKFLERGFEVVGCPTLHVFDAAWCHLEDSEENCRTVIDDARQLGLQGVCLTTWESGLFGAYDTLFPMLRAVGEALSVSSDASDLQDKSCAVRTIDFHSAFRACSAEHDRWSHLMGVELTKLGGVFTFDGHRSRLKSRFLMYSNPFLLWMRHGEELSGEIGDDALAILERAEAVAPGEAEQGVTRFVKSAVEFARLAEKARLAYAETNPGEALRNLATARALFDDLERIAKKSHRRIGGSLADVERCRACRAQVETVMRRIKDYGDGSLGYLPAFEIITHPMFVPHDQACWWLVNKWGKE